MFNFWILFWCYFNLFFYRDFNLHFLKRVITKSSKTRFCASNYTITRCFRLNRDKVENPFYNCPKKRDKLTFWSEVDKALLTEKKNNLFWKKRSRRHFGGPVYQRDFGLFSFNIQWKIYVHNIVFLFFLENRSRRIYFCLLDLQRTAFHEFANLRRKIIWPVSFIR